MKLMRSSLSSACFVGSPVICLHSEQNRQLPSGREGSSRWPWAVKNAFIVALAWIRLQQGSIDGSVGFYRSTRILIVKGVIGMHKQGYN